jgi:large subunit ribosomal protein L28
MARNKRRVSAAKPQFGQNKPFSQKRTRRQFKPNMQRKRIFVPELGRTVRVRISTSELKTIDKIGLNAFLKRRGLSLKDVQ